MITAVLFVVAAAAGTALRLGVRRLVPAGPLPWPTLLVNVAGSFALGLLAGVAPTLATVVGVGGLGALTTFSSFVGETLSTTPTGRRHPGPGALYVLATLVLCIGAATVGLRLAPA